MKVEIQQKPPFGAALITLEAGEQFVSESGAMYRASGNMDIDVTTKSKGKGGLLKGLKRMLASDSFFLSTYTTTDGQQGEVALAPTLEGEVKQLDLAPECAVLCTGGSFLGAGPDIELDTQFQGLRGMFSGESLFFLKCSGQGPLLVNAFGRIQEVPVDGGLVVDTGHVVAFEETLDYSLTKAGKSWLKSMVGGEGIVMRFSGRGRVWTQSHDPGRFGSSVGPKLPPRNN